MTTVTLADMGTPALEDLLSREVYAENGRFLGTIESVSMGRGPLPARIGVLMDGASKLAYFPVAGARLEGNRVLVPAMPSLEIVE